MDPLTGLPTIPWPDHFWRVYESTPGYFYIELRKKTRVLGLWDSSESISREIILYLNKEQIIEDAYVVLSRVEQSRVGIELLGDYPPKSLND